MPGSTMPGSTMPGSTMLGSKTFGSKTLKSGIIAVISMSFLTGFGLGDIKIGSDKDCKGSSKCENKEKMKDVSKVVAIGVAAKLIEDMVIKQKSKKIKDRGETNKKYLETHKKLPEKTELSSYKTTIKPGEVVKVGKKITIKSAITVVAGKDVEKVKIEEKIEIYDNEDHSKVIQSLVKAVNKNSAPGTYQNKFTFKLPKGMPQGVYPIKTSILIDGKEAEVTDSKMQIVMLEADHDMHVAMLDMAQPSTPNQVWDDEFSVLYHKMRL